MPDLDDVLADRVLSLRQAGASVESIADRFSIPLAEAQAILDRALDSYDRTRTAALEASRLDRLLVAVWPQAVKGDLLAVDRAVRLGERMAVVTAEPAKNEHRLRTAFDQAVESSEAAPTLDRALIAVGEVFADRVDNAIATGEGTEVTKALYLLPHFMNVLREMHATPASRLAAGLAAKPDKGGTLSLLRSEHRRPDDSAVNVDGRRTGA